METTTEQLATLKARVEGGLDKETASTIVSGLNSLFSHREITAAQIAAWLQDTPFFASVVPHVHALDDFKRLAERIVAKLGDVVREASERHIRKGCYLTDVDTTPIAKAVETLIDILRHHPRPDIYDYVVGQVVGQSTCITALVSLGQTPRDAILATSAVQAILDNVQDMAQDMAQDPLQSPNELKIVLEKLSSQYLPHELYRLNEHFLVEGAAEESVLTHARDRVRRILGYYKGLEEEMAYYTEMFNKPTVKKYGRAPLSELLSYMARFRTDATRKLLQDCSDPTERQRLTDLVQKYTYDEEEQLNIFRQVHESEKKLNQEAPTELLRKRVHALMATHKPIDVMSELNALADEEGEVGDKVREQLSGAMYLKTLVRWYENLDFEGKARLVEILSKVCHGRLPGIASRSCEESRWTRLHRCNGCHLRLHGACAHLAADRQRHWLPFASIRVGQYRHCDGRGLSLFRHHHCQVHREVS